MSDTQEAPTEDVIVTNGMIGLLFMSVCAYGEVPPERVQQRANTLNPAGTSGGWFIITDNEGDNEGKGPVPCSEFPERMH